uniref:hypothetical protein n=1 Tax=Alistipes shahii TaxID=328814 RepID=UPI002FDDB859
AMQSGWICLEGSWYYLGGNNDGASRVFNDGLFIKKSMNRFIVSIYNKFSQLINFCVKLFLLFRIWKRNSF